MRAAVVLAAAVALTLGAAPAQAEDPLEDLTPPDLQMTPMAGGVDGWYADTATVFVKATDPGRIATGVVRVGWQMSGATSGSGTVDRTAGGTLTVTNSGLTTIDAEAVDGNDNHTFGQVQIGIDRDNPTAAFTGRLAEPTPVFAQGEQVTVDYTCGDGTSGIASCTGTYLPGASLQTQTLGTFSVQAQAKDRVGHLTTVVRSYQVVSNQFVVTRDVDVLGTKVVGSQVQAQPPLFDPTPTSVTYRWTRNGVAIPGATGTSYTPTPDDARQTLRLEATASRSGWQDRTVVSPAYQVQPATISIGAAPELSGEARVGGQLQVDHGSVTPAAAAISYQWLRDGVLVPEASGRRYFPVAADMGSRISVRVVATAPGYAEAVWVSPVSDVVRGRTLEVTGVPSVSGPMQAGAVLTATGPLVRVPLPSRSGEPASLTHQWLRDGLPVPGATQPTYRLGAADVGHRVAVRVTATRPPSEGYEPVVLTSAAGQPVEKATPTVAARAKAQGRGRVRIAVTVSVPGLDPSAAVTVTRGNKVVARGTVSGAGGLVLSLKHQPRGKVTWTVTYAGSAGVAAQLVRVSTRVR